ncbi:MAG: hypothetical protein ACRDIB_14560, partial [Ardenticatenaceae bacterium]
LTGWMLRAWRYGDWDISAGQFFVNFDINLHVIEPFFAPSDWRFWLALDYGFTHYTVIYLLAQSHDGTIYIVDEHAERQWLVPQHAAALRTLLARNHLETRQLEAFVAGSDVFARTGAAERTIAEQYADEGFDLEPADMDRVNGAAQIMRRLGNPNRGIAPTLFIFDRCKRLAATLPALVHNPNRPEDVLKVDADEDGSGGDDAYDSCRYGVMFTTGRLEYAPSPAVGYRG